MILEKFGYNHKLEIDDEYLVTREDIIQDANEKWENVELSKNAIQFLTGVFKCF